MQQIILMNIGSMITSWLALGLLKMTDVYKTAVQAYNSSHHDCKHCCLSLGLHHGCQNNAISFIGIGLTKAFV